MFGHSRSDHCTNTNALAVESSLCICKSVSATAVSFEPCVRCNREGSLIANLSMFLLIHHYHHSHPKKGLFASLSSRPSVFGGAATRGSHPCIHPRNLHEECQCTEYGQSKPDFVSYKGYSSWLVVMCDFDCTACTWNQGVFLGAPFLVIADSARLVGTLL